MLSGDPQQESHGIPTLVNRHLKDTLVVGVEVPQLSDGGNDLVGTLAAQGPALWMVCWTVRFLVLPNFSVGRSVFFMNIGDV